MISSRRGIPSVAFLDETPAKWNVLSVICVAGSLIDWAASAPTDSPGTAAACRYCAATSASAQSSPASVRCRSKTMIREAKYRRATIAKSSVTSVA